MPGLDDVQRYEYDEKTGMLVPVDAGAGGGWRPRAGGSVLDVPRVEWDDATGGLVEAGKRDAARTAQPKAESETSELWDTFVRTASDTARKVGGFAAAAGREINSWGQEEGTRMRDEAIARSQGVMLNYFDDVMPGEDNRAAIRRAAVKYPGEVAAGQAATSGLASALAPATYPMQIGAGAAVGLAAARGKNAGLGETLGDTALGGLGGAIGQLYSGMFGQAFRPKSATPRVKAPSTAPELSLADEWNVNMHTPTEEEVARAGWLRPAGEAADTPAAPRPLSVRPPRTTGSPSQPPAGFVHGDEVVPAEMRDLLADAHAPPDLPDEQLTELSRRTLSRSGRPTRPDWTLTPREVGEDIVGVGDDIRVRGPASMPWDRQTGGHAPMPYDEFASNQGVYKPRADEPIMDREIAGLMSGRVPPAPPPRPSRMGPPPSDPLEVPPPELALETSLRRARANELPRVDRGPMDLSDVEMPVTTRPALLPNDAPPPGPDPTMEAMLGEWRPPTFTDRVRGALERELPNADVPGAARTATNAAFGWLEGQTGPAIAPRDDVPAYATAPVMSWTLQSVLASGDTGLPPLQQQRLTEAVMSGDPAQAAAVDYVLKQKYPDYARRMERALKQLNDED